MIQDKFHRIRGMSLLELLVVITIIAVLIGLLLPAVQKVRQASLRADTSNRARQIVLAIHQAADAADGVLPSVSPDPPRQYFSQFTVLLPYIEQANVLQKGSQDTPIAFYQSRTDPSYSAYPEREGNVSFASNAMLFRPGQRLANVSDGTTNTIALTERYARCGASVEVTWTHANSLCSDLSGNVLPCTGYDIRRATFADSAYDDVIPTDANLANLKIFQLAPLPAACDPTVPQGPQQSGIVCVMADGSTHVIGGGIQPATFWALVTPNSGEVVTDW
jgi:prepilin-type N-terminal cleavage/methylation domain-containing protein